MIEPLRPMRLRPPSAEERAALIRVARREAPADVWLRGGTVLNVYTGEWLRAEVALHGRWIAYVGPEAPHHGETTEIVDVSDRVLVPGYIEPHAHPFQLYHPYTLADFALKHGTTVLIADNMVLFHALELEAWQAFMAAMSTHPVKLLWWARTTPQAHDQRLQARYTPSALKALAASPYVVQAGELTDFLPLTAGDPDALARLSPFLARGLRVESHAPGASYETLLRLVLAGATADHEAINGEELMSRLRLGLYTPLRHSSIRPDLPELLQTALDVPAAWTRMTLTTDGSTPPFLRDGLIDHLIAVAIESGFSPAWAYRLATANAAEYYRLDDVLGAVAPGRLADVNILEDPCRPTPIETWIEGRRQSKAHREPFDGSTVMRTAPNAARVEVSPSASAFFRLAPLTADDLIPRWTADDPYPLIRLRSDVITVVEPQKLPRSGERVDFASLGDDVHIAALIDQAGRWVTAALVAGLGAGPLTVASTYTASGDVLVFARRPEEALSAYREIVERPGILWRTGDRAGHLSLPLFGRMSDLPMEALIDVSGRFVEAMREAGFRHRDPIYTLLFMSSTHLPRVRLTARGVLSIKDGAVLIPSQPLSAV
ncbi:MAG: adenine deaminase [Hydrogenibacillus sp.]|nr:adenine deaminase [Hydrogenibacillus sp.]